MPIFHDVLLEVWCLLLALTQLGKKEHPAFEGRGKERGIRCLTQIGFLKLLGSHLPILPQPFSAPHRSSLPIGECRLSLGFMAFLDLTLPASPICFLPTLLQEASAAVGPGATFPSALDQSPRQALIVLYRLPRRLTTAPPPGSAPQPHPPMRLLLCLGLSSSPGLACF